METFDIEAEERETSKKESGQYSYLCSGSVVV